MKPSTKDQAQGNFHKATGKLKEIAGKLSMNPKLEAEGKDEKRAGKVQKKSAKSRRSWGSSRAAYHAPATP
jgi:uncharacterized protein YjbJ (UPF0337 family)